VVGVGEDAEIGGDRFGDHRQGLKRVLFVAEEATGRRMGEIKHGGVLVAVYAASTRSAPDSTYSDSRSRSASHRRRCRKSG